MGERYHEFHEFTLILLNVIGTVLGLSFDRGSFYWTYIVMGSISLALIILCCVPILLTISLIMRKRMRDAFSENRKNVATINQSLESSITGIRVTKAFTNKEKELESVREERVLKQIEKELSNPVV